MLATRKYPNNETVLKVCLTMNARERVRACAIHLFLLLHLLNSLHRYINPKKDIKSMLNE